MLKCVQRTYLVQVCPYRLPQYLFGLSKSGLLMSEYWKHGLVLEWPQSSQVRLIYTYLCIPKARNHITDWPQRPTQSVWLSTSSYETLKTDDEKQREGKSNRENGSRETIQTLSEPQVPPPPPPSMKGLDRRLADIEQEASFLTRIQCTEHMQAWSY